MTLTLPISMSAPSSINHGQQPPLQTEWHNPKNYIQVVSYNELLKTDSSGVTRFQKPIKLDQVIVRFCSKNRSQAAVSREPTPNDLNIQEWNALYSILGQLVEHVQHNELFKYQLVPDRSQFINSARTKDRYGADLYYISLNRHYMPADCAEYRHGRANVSFSAVTFLDFVRLAPSVNETVQTMQTHLDAEAAAASSMPMQKRPADGAGGGGDDGFEDVDFSQFFQPIPQINLTHPRAPPPAAAPVNENTNNTNEPTPPLPPPPPTPTKQPKKKSKKSAK